MGGPCFFTWICLFLQYLVTHGFVWDFTIVRPKGWIMSEDIGGFLPLPKNIPKNYLKLSYPVHGNDKVLVVFNRLHVKKYHIY